MAGSTTLKTFSVSPGLAEYAAKIKPSTSGDDLKIEFNSEVTMEDIVVDINSATLTYDINVLYPASQKALQIKGGLTSDYAMNRDINLNESKTNLWYSVPPRTALQIKVSGLTTADDIDVVVIGRGG